MDSSASVMPGRITSAPLETNETAPASTVTTFVFVMLGFTFTRSNDLGAAVDAFRLMLYGGW
mgnify:CR=1 FL=1